MMKQHAHSPWLVGALAALLTTLPPAPAGAQEPHRQAVRDIQVRHLDDAPADPAYVLAHVAARPGHFVSQRELSRDQRTLLDTGRFSDVQILLEPLADGVRIIYAVRRRLRYLPPIAVRGARSLSASKVRDLIGLTEGDYVDDALLASRCGRVREEYRRRHYPEADVSATVIPAGTNGLGRVAVTIDEGVRRRLAGFIFEGNRAIDDATLRAALGQPGRFNPFAPFFRKWRRDANDFEFVRDSVRDLYLERGYLDVRVEAPRLVDGPAAGQPRLAVAIAEGELYRIGNVGVAGVTLFPAAELEAVAGGGLRPGDVAARGAIQAVARALRDYYGRRGYVDTAVRARSSAAGRDVNVLFEIREGVLARVRNVYIRGNTRTKDKVVRREIGLLPGAVFDEVLAERSRRRVENLGFFESVRFYENAAPGDPGQRDAVYEVVEKNTGQFMMGAGFSSVDNVIGFAEVNQSNFDIANWPYFHGGGQKARASFEIGSERKNIDVSLTEPWFLDRRLALSLEGYRRERGYSEFDETRSGGGLGLTVPLPVGRANLRCVFEQVRLSDIEQGEFVAATDATSSYRFTDEEDKYFNTPLRLTWIYDTRNRPFVPTRGMQASIFGEVSGRMLGGDNEVYSLGFRARHWQPLWAGHVLSLLVRAESVDTIGAQDEVYIGDRLFLGGGRTLRGFEYRDVGPKVLPAVTGGGAYHPVGGRTMAMASVEYTVPLFKVLRLAAFYDIGNVWSESFDADFGQLASSVGGGIRFDIPGFPIRFDYAVPLEFDDEYTDAQRWSIWIGFE